MSRVDVLAVFDDLRWFAHSAMTVDDQHRLTEARAAVAEVYAQRDEYAARLAEDRALLDAIRDSVGGGPYDTIARRVAELIDATNEYFNGEDPASGAESLADATDMRDRAMAQRGLRVKAALSRLTAEQEAKE